jgi:hypothetical protein
LVLFGNDGKEATVSSNIDLIEIDVAYASTTIIPYHTNTIRAELDGKG